MPEQFDHTEEFDEAYALMMDALDGALSAVQERELQQYLDDYPVLAAEWRSMQVVDSWLTDAPLVEPAADFTEQTMLRLPNLSIRRWAFAISYALVLILGMVPILGAAVALTAFSSADLVGSLQFLSSITRIVAEAALQIMVSWGDFVTQNPATIGMFLLMIGAITLWSGVYNQMVNRPVVVRSV